MYENGSLKYTNTFCEWLGIDWRALCFVLNQHRNSLHWNEESPGLWTPVKKYTYEKAVSEMEFIENSKLSNNHRSKYITVGKGWP